MSFGKPMTLGRSAGSAIIRAPKLYPSLNPYSGTLPLAP